MEQVLELGLDTFGDVTEGADGAPVSYAHVIRDVIDEAVLADELGVDFIGVGEHHWDDFAVSPPGRPGRHRRTHKSHSRGLCGDGNELG
jgi:hypothetical protein